MRRFIIGTITERLPAHFEKVRRELENEGIGSTYQIAEKKDKMEKVFDSIDDCDEIIALCPRLSTGTTLEIGYSIARGKTVKVITSSSEIQRLTEHPILTIPNLKLMNIDDFSTQNL